MEQITCPICRNELSSADQSCPKCGYKIPENLFEKNLNESIFKRKEAGIPKLKKVLFILVFIILMISFSFYNWIKDQNNLTQENPAVSDNKASSHSYEQGSTNIHKVQYVVTGTAKSGNITIQIPGGGTEQHDISLPYKSPTYEFKNGDFTFLLAINQSEGGGSITAEIIVNGKSLRKATCTGEYSTASVRWTVGSDD